MESFTLALNVGDPEHSVGLRLAHVDLEEEVLGTRGLVLTFHRKSLRICFSHTLDQPSRRGKHN